MKNKEILLTLLIALKAGLLGAGEIKLVRTFETWDAGIIKSTDPAGIVYHPPSGHLFISDSEINEIAMIWNCGNIFEINLAGDQLFNTFDAYDPGGRPCLSATNFSNREPTGITFNEFDGFFYVSDDNEQAIMRYNKSFGAPLVRHKVVGADFEGITSDPSTGFLYVVSGEGQDEVNVYSSDLVFLSRFSVAGIATDPEGIAFSSQLNHLFILGGRDKRIYEFTLEGNLVNDYDISNFLPKTMDPQGLTFAPSSDPSDDPDNFHLYIVDGQVDNDPDPDLDRDGLIYEAEIFPFDFFADKKFKMEDKHGDSNGTVHSNDKIEFKKGLPSSHAGNLTAVKNIIIKEHNTINGNVIAGGKLDVKSGATINGIENGEATIARVGLPWVSFSDGEIDIKLEDDEIRSLDPGSYGKMEANKRSTLILRSGEYYFKKMDLKDDVLLSINATNGEVTINVVDEVKFHKRAYVDITPFGESGSRYLTVKQVKDNVIMFDDGARFWGSIIAPLAKKVQIKKNAEFKGLIVAKEIEVNKYATLISHSSSLSLTKNLARRTEIKTDEAERHSSPSDFTLSQNYPNPFNPNTQIRFQLPRAAHIIMRIYNIRGQEIRRLLDSPYAKGTYIVSWDSKDDHGNPVPSGVYFYQIKAGEFFQSKKMSLLK